MISKLINKYKSLSAPAKASIWFFFARVMQKGISVITTPIFTRILTTEEYGVYTSWTAWFEILSILLTLRLFAGVFVQGLVRYDNDKDEYTSALEGLTTLCVLIGLIVYLPFQEQINALTGMNTFLMLMIFLSAWASAIFGFWSARQRVEYRYRALVAVTIGSSLAKPISGIVAILNTEMYKVEARVGTLVAVEMLFYTGMFVYYLLKGRKVYDQKYWSHALRFNIPLIPHYLSQSLLSQSDRIMVRDLVSKSAAGIYGLGYSVSSLMTMVTQSINSTLEPWLYQKIKEGDTKSIAGVSYLMIACVGVANLMLVAIAPEAIYIFAPEEYASATWVIPPLAASTFLTFMYCLFAVFEFYFERTRLVMIASVVGAVINIGLNLLLIPRFGFIAAGYTTLVGYASYIFMHYVFMRKVQKEEMGGIEVYSPRILASLIAAYGIITVLLALAYPCPLVRLVFCVLLVAAAYLNRDKVLETIQILRSAKRNPKE